MAGWAAVAVAVIGAGASQEQQRKSESQAADRFQQELDLQEALADQSTTDLTVGEGEVELTSEEELEDAAIRGASKRNRLRVGQTNESVGTGLSVG